MVQKLEIMIRNNENTGNLSAADVAKVTEIITALVSTGSLIGVKAGRTIIHFDPNGVFQSIELDYHPWRRRANNV